MTEHEALFLFLMAIGAFFMPFISKRLLLPAAVGEIIYGIVIVSVLPGSEIYQEKNFCFMYQFLFQWLLLHGIYHFT